MHYLVKYFFSVFQRSASTLPGAVILNVAQCKMGTDDVSWLLRFKSPCLVYYFVRRTKCRIRLSFWIWSFLNLFYFESRSGCACVRFLCLLKGS